MQQWNTGIMTDSQNTQDRPEERSITLTRVGEKHYRATNADGVSIEFGQGESLMAPGELFLAALAGCSAVDVDVVTTRRTEPEQFVVEATANRVTEGDATRFDDIALKYNLVFPDTKEGNQADSLVEKVIQLSHDKNCTVSRTIEAGSQVKIRR